MPVIGFLNALGRNDAPDLPAAFRRGLGEAGYVEARNAASTQSLACALWVMAERQLDTLISSSPWNFETFPALSRLAGHLSPETSRCYRLSSF